VNHLRFFGLTAAFSFIIHAGLGLFKDLSVARHLETPLRQSTNRPSEVSHDEQNFIDFSEFNTVRTSVLLAGPMEPYNKVGT
jgi:hypothetical protein